jgi:hypothetical protein
MVGRSFANHLVDRRSFIIGIQGHTSFSLLAAFIKRCGRSSFEEWAGHILGFAKADRVRLL